MTDGELISRAEALGVSASYVNWRPKRLLLTMRAGGVLPEWRRLVRHHRARQVRRAIAAVDLRPESMRGFGPRFARKWHVLMKGCIVAAGEGDRLAARRAREVGRVLLASEPDRSLTSSASSRPPSVTRRD